MAFLSRVIYDVLSYRCKIRKKFEPEFKMSNLTFKLCTNTGTHVFVENRGVFYDCICLGLLLIVYLRKNKISASFRGVMELLPENIRLEAELATANLLPSKSKTVYDKEYSSFNTWKRENLVSGNSEDVLLAYFSQKVSY